MIVKKHLPKITILVVVILGLVLRIIPTFGNNFYFTMDIANEATKAREIIFFRLHPLVGQETSIPGFYHGPLWLYYISIGYLLFNFHPFGSLFMLFLLNAASTAVLMWRVIKKVSLKAGILIGVALQFFWPYYDTTRFAFSPFPLVVIAVVDLVLLSAALEGSVAALIGAAVVSSLPLHLEVASLPPFLGLFLTVALWLFIKKKFTGKQFLYAILALIATHAARIVSEVLTGFSQLHAIQEHAASERSFISATQFVKFFGQMVGIVKEGLVPQSGVLSILLILASVLVLYKRKKMNPFILRYAVLTLILCGFSFVWFASNIGWHPWHTVYIAPVIFISALLIGSSFKLNRAIPVCAFLIAVQLPVFYKNYALNFRPTNDASILSNELSAVDWTYKESGGQGFYVYSYLPSVYDYPYQYLFWWRGNGKYGYVPCEYSTYPGIPDFFVNNYQKYQQPQRQCERVRYLIMEPDQNTGTRALWLSEVSKNNTLEKEANFGNIRVEKRRITP